MYIAVAISAWQRPQEKRFQDSLEECDVIIFMIFLFFLLLLFVLFTNIIIYFPFLVIR